MKSTKLSGAVLGSLVILAMSLPVMAQAKALKEDNKSKDATEKANAGY